MLSFVVRTEGAASAPLATTEGARDVTSNRARRDPVDGPRRDPPVHEGIVGICAEADADEHAVYCSRPKNQASSGFSSSSRVNGRRCSERPSDSDTVRSSSSAAFAWSSASPSS